MTRGTLSTHTRSAETSQRRTLLALGGAGLAATLAGALGASAKNNAGKKARKKAKKKCKQQTASCTDQVTAFCEQVTEEVAECKAALLPCCAECDVALGVTCTINALIPVS